MVYVSIHEIHIIVNIIHKLKIAPQMQEAKLTK